MPALERTPRQTTDTVVMISPDQFAFNPQTAKTNKFQVEPATLSEHEIQVAASAEFGHMIDTLRLHDINVLVLPSREDAVTPDAVFPNNWFSHHEEGTLVIYPMLTPNRRDERQVGNLQTVLASAGILQPELLDLTDGENHGDILEGTGSLVLDREHKVAFAMESLRTTRNAFDEWCKEMGYDPVFFHAYDSKNVPIYHTNVVMGIGDRFAVACLDAITDEEERHTVEDRLIQLGKDIIPITLEQMLKGYCGNILQTQSVSGEAKIVLSDTAFNAFTSEQRVRLQQYGELVPVHIPTIETVGGGSARCMLAEVFPPEAVS